MKNINFINLDGTNFELNDNEYKKIDFLSQKISKKDLLLLWQFTLNNLEKIEIIKNQHQFVEMFLVRLLYLKEIVLNKNKPELEKFTKDLNINKSIVENKIQVQQETVNQLKNVDQKEKVVTPPDVKNKIEELKITNFEDLIKLCEDKKELKIKYELENNLRLVSFKDRKIEFSFSSKLEKTFVKELSNKLQEWTDKRWIIALTKESGLPTVKEQKKNLQEDLLEKNLNLVSQKKLKKSFLMQNF